MNDPSRKTPGSTARQFAIATELPFILVAGVGFGGFVGYLLDGWLHTKPFLMLIVGAAGFIAGLREMLRRLAKSDNDGSRSGS